MDRLDRTDALAEFCFPEGETLLGVLCFAAKRQGGTIHQFFPQGMSRDWISCTGRVRSRQGACIRSIGGECEVKTAKTKAKAISELASAVFDNGRRGMPLVPDATACNALGTRDQAMRDMGMVKVRGALGGTYWE